MNLDQLHEIMKKHGLDPKNYDINFSTIYETFKSYHEDLVLQIVGETAATCCGVNEIGDIDLSDRWIKLPPEVQLAMVSYMLPDSKNFQIVYSLENSKSWERFNECLFELGWTPLKRWKGTGKNMIQAWCK